MAPDPKRRIPAGTAIKPKERGHTSAASKPKVDEKNVIDLSDLSKTNGPPILRHITWKTIDADMERFITYDPREQDHQSTMEMATMLMENTDEFEIPPRFIEKLKAMVEYLQGLEEQKKRLQEHISKHDRNVSAWTRQAEQVCQYLEDKVSDAPRLNKRKADEMERCDEDLTEISDADFLTIHGEDRSEIIDAIRYAIPPNLRTERVMTAVTVRLSTWNAMTREDWENKDSWVHKSDLACHRLPKKALQKLYDMEFLARKRLGLFTHMHENQKSEMPKFRDSDYKAVWAETPKKMGR